MKTMPPPGKPSRILYLIFCEILFAACSLIPNQLFSQWNRIATSAFSGLSTSGGMLHFKNGVLWGGNTNVSYSLDSGKTWTLSLLTTPLNDRIQNIDFFDDQIGLVRTANSIYITTNRGA